LTRLRQAQAPQVRHHPERTGRCARRLPNHPISKSGGHFIKTAEKIIGSYYRYFLVDGSEIFNANGANLHGIVLIISTVSYTEEQQACGRISSLLHDLNAIKSL
jgi:hypothetical protein